MPVRIERIHPVNRGATAFRRESCWLKIGDLKSRKVKIVELENKRAKLCSIKIREIMIMYYMSRGMEPH